MSYNVNTQIDSESASTNFLDVGIHDDVELKNVEYKTTDKGNEFMVFEFEKNGKTVSHTEWQPKDDNPENLENKRKNQIKRVKHIVTKFIPEEKYVFDVDDFKGFCDNTIKILGDSYKGKKVRIKVIYSWSNFTSLPRYVPFIETMDIPVEESKLEVLSIDKMKKDQADREVSESNPFDKSEGEKSENSKDSNVPF